MRFAIILLSAICIHAVSQTGNAQYKSDNLQFPYQALVLSEQAEVHSGPGAVHYSTSTLSQGDSVEVHRHDPGGWCAIRPTEGSFSLIPESTLEIIEDGIGRIKTSGTQAWVGTGEGPVEKPMWQIKLKEGEIVEVLGQVSWPSPEGHSTQWYQIAPPAGEFRWIRMSDIQLPSSHTVEPANRNFAAGPSGNGSSKSSNTHQNVRSLLAAPTSIQTNPGYSSSQSTGNTNPAPINAPQQPNVLQVSETTPVIANSGLATKASFQVAESTTDSSSSNLGWRRSSRPIKKELNRNTNRFTLSGNSAQSSTLPKRNIVQPAYASPVLNDSPLTNNPPVFSDQSIRVASANLSRESFARGLNSNFPTQPTLNGMSISELELALTKQMANSEPANWELSGILAATERFINSRPGPQDQQRAEKLVKRIGDCRSLQLGFQNNAANRPSTRKQQSGGTSNSIAQTAAASDDVTLSTRFDAHGWLNEMVQKGGRTEPTYVLLNDQGKIIYHIAPAAGINIHRYLKSKVGIVGQRGYHTRLKLNHVTANQIVELEKPRDRLY